MSQKHNENNILPHLNIAIYKQALEDNCLTILSQDTINIVSNMLSMNEALKHQDHSEGRTANKPKDQELVAREYAQNIVNYFSNPKNQQFQGYVDDWMMVFSIALKEEEREHDSHSRHSQLDIHIANQDNAEDGNNNAESEDLTIHYKENGRDVDIDLHAGSFGNEEVRKEIGPNKLVANFSASDHQELQSVMSFAKLNISADSTNDVAQPQFSMQARSIGRFRQR